MKTLRPWARRTVVLLCLFGACLAEAGPQSGGVVAWGRNYEGETDVPLGLSDVVAIAGGYYHSLALQSNGRVLAWGLGSLGQTNIPVGLSNVVAVAAGDYYGLALQSNGGVVAWGDNSLGQTNVPPGLSNIVAIAAGGNHSLALQSNGRVLAWGYNGYGQTNVPPGLNNVATIAAGAQHSLALQSNGMVVAWGDNCCGQTTVPPGLSNVATIAAGDGNSLALQSNGTVVAWGYYYGTVPPGLSNVVAIAAHTSHCLALQNTGILVAWGWDEYGETDVPSGLTNVVAIAAGGTHSLAVTPGPFIFPQPPATISLASGASTTLTLPLASASPFTCHWALNGLLIAGATGTSLAITNFDLTKAGAYSVAVTNQYGNATAVTVLRLTNSPVVLVDGIDVGGGPVTPVHLPQITMSSTFGLTLYLYYTLDGTAPDFTAIPYAGPFILTNSATIRAIAYNFAYTDWAEAAPISVQVLPTHLLAASTPGGGSISLSPPPYSADNRYITNTVVTLTATPSNGWSFIHWAGDSTATTNVVAFLMDQPRSLQALFGTSLGLFTNGSGQAVLNPATGPYPFGSTVQLTALPSPGFYFFGWANAASGFANPLLFSVTNATPAVTALFGALKSNQVSLAVLPNGNGTVAINPAWNVYTNGDTVTLTAVPATNYIFAGWSGDASGKLSPLVLSLDTNKLITANFALATATNLPPVFQTVVRIAGTLTVAWSAVTGRAYQVQYRTNLLQTNWSNLGSGTFATNGTMSASDSTGPDQQRFYRVALLP